MKRCPTCRVEKDESEFIRNRSTPSGVGGYCRPCAAERAKKRRLNDPRAAVYAKDWSRKNKDKMRVYRRRNLLKNQYGLSIEDYEQMVEAQNGLCAVCEKEPEGGRHEVLYVDHDHATGRTRLLLCAKCNFAIGLLGDDVEVARRLVAYLQRFMLASHAGGKG